MHNMKMLTAGAALVAATLNFVPQAVAQQACWVNGAPPGTIAQCGYGVGQYRPQPQTLTAQGRPVQNPRDSYYAPVAPDGRYWRQYQPSTNTYGPQEINPYNSQGRLNPLRTVEHLTTTRVIPYVQRQVQRHQ
jgi:hypothetical protein